MKIALLILLFMFSFNIIESRIHLDFSASGFNTYSAIPYGEEESPVTDEDIPRLFNNPSLYNAVKMYEGRMPNDVYYSKPTPWGDLYTRYGWAPVTKKIKVQYAKFLHTYSKQSVVVTQDFDNPSSHTIKVNTGLTHIVENTATTSWTSGSVSTQSSNFGVDINFNFLGISGGSSMSTTTFWGRNEFRSEKVTIGITQGMETELRPGQSVRSELEVTRKYMLYEVKYVMSLRGSLAVNYNPTRRGHHFHRFSVRKVMKAAGLNNERKFTQTITFVCNIDAKIRVTDRVTGLLL